MWIIHVNLESFDMLVRPTSGSDLTKSMRHNFLQVCINGGARSNCLRGQFL